MGCYGAIYLYLYIHYTRAAKKKDTNLKRFISFECYEKYRWT